MQFQPVFGSDVSVRVAHIAQGESSEADHIREIF